MQKYCDQCGAELNDDAKFCHSCGAKVGSSTNQANNVPADDSEKTIEHPIEHQLGAIATKPSFEYDSKGSEIIKKNDEQGEATVEFRNLHPNAKILFIISYMKLTGIVLILFVVMAVVQLMSTSEIPIYFLIAIPAYFVILYLFASLAYKNYRYEVTKNAFIIDYGILQKQTVNIPYDRIQNINVRRDLIDQFLGLAHLDIETAATGGTVVENSVGGSRSVSEGYIPGISPKEANDLRVMLLSFIDK